MYNVIKKGRSPESPWAPLYSPISHIPADVKPGLDGYLLKCVDIKTHKNDGYLMKLAGISYTPL